jgi:hypothetical protein
MITIVLIAIFFLPNQDQKQTRKPVKCRRFYLSFCFGKNFTFGENENTQFKFNNLIKQNNEKDITNSAAYVVTGRFNNFLLPCSA